MKGLKPVLFGSIVIGIMLGLSYEEWQMAIESAQVQAGLVAYPPSNSFFMYHLKIWTLMVQLPALMLKYGITDPQANLIISASMGAILYSVQSVICYLMSRSIIFSIIFPATVWVSRMFQLGDTYEIMLYDEPHTFGILAPAYALMLFQLQALGKERLSGFLLGLAPAIHPTVGVWTLGITTLHGISGSAFGRGWRRWAPFFAVGCLLTIISFVVHLSMSSALPAIGAEEARRYLEGFTASWDMHRRPVRPTSLAVMVAFLLVALAMRFRRAGPQSSPAGLLPIEQVTPEPVVDKEATILLELLGLSAGAALFCAGLSHFQSWLPSSLVAAMPWRNLNISGMAFPFVLGGLLARGRDSVQMQGLLLVLLLCFRNPVLLSGAPFRGAWAVVGITFLLVVGWPSSRPPGRSLRTSRRILIMLVASLAATLATRPELYRTVFPEIRTVFDSSVPSLALLASGLLLVLKLPDRLAGVIRGLSTVLLLVLSFIAGLEAVEASEMRSERLASSVTDPLFSQIAEEAGVLVTASDLTRIQVRTRHPVLLHGYNLNVLPYVLESGPAMESALQKVYGLSLFHPPGRRIGGMDSEDGRKTFESRTERGWAEVASEFQLTQVLTPRSWTLNLPLAAENSRYRLWQIPRAEGSQPSSP